MSLTNQIDHIHAQILSELPVYVRLGRVHAPEVNAAAAVVDESGDMVPVNESEPERRRRKLLKLIGLRKPRRVQGSIASYIVKAQRQMSVGARLKARLTAVFRHPLVLLMIGASVGSMAWMGTSHLRTGAMPVVGPDDQELANVQAQPAQLEEPFGEPLVRASAASAPDAVAMSPDQVPVPPQVIKSLRPLDALPTPVAEAGGVPVPPVSKSMPPKTTSPTADQAERANDMAALQEEDHSPKAAQKAPSAPPASPAQTPVAKQAGPVSTPPVTAVTTQASVPPVVKPPVAQLSQDAKQKVTWKYGHLGIAAITPDGVVVAAGKDRRQQKLTVGDKLPNGSVIVSIDAKNDRISTDRAVVQMQ